MYLYEKWFYRVNRRRKIKYLPDRGLNLKDKLVVPKMKSLSRRFSIKSMYMGVMGHPQRHRGFDGRICIKRISRTRFVPNCSIHINFSDDVIINHQIKQQK